MKIEIKLEIEKKLNELISLKGILPGSISEQYNVCGTPNCKCKDPENPQKHGPYHQLSYTASGKSSSKFIKKEDINIAVELNKNYKRFKDICSELPGLYIDLFKSEGFNAELPNILENLESPRIKEQQERIEQLEVNLDEVRKRSHTQYVTIKDILKSRENWKEKSMKSKAETVELEKEKIKLEKQNEKLENKLEILIEAKKKRH